MPIATVAFGCIAAASSAIASTSAAYAGMSAEVGSDSGWHVTSMSGTLGTSRAERLTILDNTIGSQPGTIAEGSSVAASEAPDVATLTQRKQQEVQLGPDRLSLQGFNAGSATSTPKSLSQMAGTSTLSRDQLEAAQDSTTVTTAATPPGIFVTPGYGFEFIDANYCSTRQQGAWIVNHYAYCDNRTIIMQHWVLKRGVRTVDGTLTLQQTLVGYGSAGTRDAQFYNWMHDLTKTGTGITKAKNLTLSIAFRCLNGTPTSAQCRTDVPELVKTPEQWNGVSTVYNISSSLSGTIDYEQLGYGDFRLEYVLYENGANPSTDTSATGTVRCDSAPYLSPASGCVFSNVVPWFAFDRNDPTVAESASHIWDAYYNPALTSPYNPTKVVPGRVDGSTGWLNRARSDTTITANRNAATALCRANDPTYASRGLECDEFPFASTYQGASFSANNWSARPISAADNNAGGTKLRIFFNADRVLDWNAFAVGVS